MKYVSPCDVHVHLRGSEYPDNNYFELGFKHAKAVGVCALMEMPNPQPWLTSGKDLDARLAYGQKYEKEYGVKHYIHAGLTNNIDQVRHILEIIMRAGYRAPVVADKTFFCHSTGNMGICNPDIQRAIWKLKGEMGYSGVSIGHFEDEKWFNVKFDPADPVSHSKRQTPQAEFVQVERQLRWAREFNFQGTFYVAHCSSLDALDLLRYEKKHGCPFRIVVEGTFHHLFLNEEDYKIHGSRVKCNPPLRDRLHQHGLLQHLERGTYDIIGTDHAPHPLSRKDDPINPASGLPCLPFWPKGIELLEGYVGKQRTEDLTYRTANCVFRLGLPRVEVEREYNPELWKDYGYNPFSRIDGTTK